LQKKIEIEVNSPLRSKKLEKKHAKKRPNISRIIISNFFAIKIFSKQWYAPKIVGGRFGFIDYKKSFTYVSLKVNGWNVLICINAQELFCLLENFFQKRFYPFWCKKLSNYVLPCLAECFSTRLGFDLWMTKRTMETFGQALAKDLIELLWKYNLRK